MFDHKFDATKSTVSSQNFPVKPFSKLELGFADATMYAQKGNKDFFNKFFYRNAHLDKLCKNEISFLIGEKGTGKTAYAVYLSNNEYKNILASTTFINESEYLKFIELKKLGQLVLADFASVWKVILYVLMAKQIIEKNQKKGLVARMFNLFPKFEALNECIDEFYLKAFSPEIIQAMMFVTDSKKSAKLMSDWMSVATGKDEKVEFKVETYQQNLLYIQRKFEEAFDSLKLDKDHVLFIDGIDIRPGNISIDEYLECVKSLAQAAWQMNHSFFANIKDSKGRMRVVLLVRPDIFSSLGLHNQNLKLKDNSVLLNWETTYSEFINSELFKIVDNILALQQNSTTRKIGETWQAYFPWNSTNINERLTNTYGNKTSFIQFLRYSFHRPRDILQMLSLLQTTFSHNQRKSYFDYDDFNNPKFQSAYSEHLLGEVREQLAFYNANTEFDLFLRFFTYLNGRYAFNYTTYLNAFKELETFINSTNETRPKYMKSANDFLQFLFELNVICYSEKMRDGTNHMHWCFRDRSFTNISPKVKIETNYEVFYGLTRALNLGKERA